MNCEEIRDALINVQEKLNDIDNEVYRANIKPERKDNVIQMIEHSGICLGVAIANITSDDEHSVINEHIFDLPVYEQDSTDEVVRRLQEARTAWLATQ